MPRSSALLQLTIDLDAAADQDDLSLAGQILNSRQALLDSAQAPPGRDLRPIVARGRKIIQDLRRRRAGLAQDIERLKRARARLTAFHPARHERKRVDIEL